MMIKVVIIMIIILLMITGCATTRDKIQQTKDTWITKTEKNVTVTRSEICQVCEVCGEDLDTVVYYFDDEIEKGISEFMDHAGEYLYCSFVRLDTDQFNDQFIELDKELNLKIIFDHDSTMDCTTACIPYAESAYNDLYGEGLRIKTVQDVHGTFCISEDGIFITSKLFDKINRKDNAFLIKSEGLHEIYDDRFTELWGVVD